VRRRSVLQGRVCHGRRRAGENRAPDVDGRPPQPHSRSRRHLGNRSTNGVGQVDMAKKQVRKKSVAKAAKPTKPGLKGGPKAAPKRTAAKTASAKAGKYVYNFGRKTDGN